LVTLAQSAGALEVHRSGSTYYTEACPRMAGLVAHCTALDVTDASGRMIESRASRIGGKTPADLRSAYKIKASGKSSTIIAIVDAFGYDNAEADLGVYRTQFGIADCTTANGCFKKLNEHGKAKNYPAQDIGWARESALDVDMASAMCPSCTIYLIEGDDNSFKSLGTAEDTAAKLGAHVISNSYAAGEAGGVKGLDHYYTHPGVVITASTDDVGYGAAYPATSPHVVAVGGTHLVADGSKRGWTETVWRGAGSGCSGFFAKPSWQKDTGCTMRMEADVSAVADPATGVAIYAPNNAGVSAWLIEGGTSVSAPLIGGIFGANGGTVSNDASVLYAKPKKFNDVVGGTNGVCSPEPDYFCTGVTGYDGPTGLGTPKGIKAFGN